MIFFTLFGSQSPMNQVTPAGGQQAVPAGPSYGLSHQGPTSAVTYGSHYAQLYSSSGTSSSNIQEYAFPERPGQPECEHYMKTGTCKYGASCKYHHPQYFSGPKSNCILSPLGLPLRPVSRSHAWFHSGNFYVSTWNIIHIGLHPLITSVHFIAWYNFIDNFTFNLHARWSCFDQFRMHFVCPNCTIIWGLLISRTHSYFRMFRTSRINAIKP